MSAEQPADQVRKPKHYNDHPSGVECIQVTEHYPFNVGNAIKYLWRAGLKGDATQDLEKAAWYILREITLRTGEPPEKLLRYYLEGEIAPVPDEQAR